LLDDNKENPFTPVPVKESEVKEKETETKPEMKDSDNSFNFKEMKTNISCLSSKLIDGPI